MLASGTCVMFLRREEKKVATDGPIDNPRDPHPKKSFVTFHR